MMESKNFSVQKLPIKVKDIFFKLIIYSFKFFKSFFVLFVT